MPTATRLPRSIPKQRKPTTKGRKLKARQEIFVREYLKDLNATQAAIRAGYEPKTADRVGPRMLGSSVVGATIAKAIHQKLNGIDSTAERVIGEASRIAHSDLREALDENGQVMNAKQLPDDIARAVSSIETTVIDGVDGAPSRTITKLKLWDKVAALTLLAKYHKLLTDKVEVSGAVTVRAEIATMSDAQIVAELEANRRAIDAAIDQATRHGTKLLPAPTFT